MTNLSGEHLVNEHISLYIFALSAKIRPKPIDTYWESRIINVLRDNNVLNERISTIGYVSNKRSFIIELADKRRFFMRILFPTNLPLPYVTRMLMGQPHCCAKAHGTNIGLPDRSSNQMSDDGKKFGIYDKLNIIPCMECFNTIEPEKYILTVAKNKHRSLQNVDVSRYQDAMCYTLMWLLTATQDDLLLVDNIDSEIFNCYRQTTVSSINKILTDTSKFCHRVINSCDPNTLDDILTIEAKRELLGISDSCLNICGAINDSDINSINMDKLSACSEHATRLRQNAQNHAFSLRYHGVDCNIIFN